MAVRIAQWMVLLLAVALAACARQPVRNAPVAQGKHRNSIDYARFVQGTVPWFHFTTLYSWDSNELGYVVVWTSPRQAYRLTLAGPCLGLRMTAGIIGLTSQDDLVSSNRDAVIAGGHHCDIMRIERLDAKAIIALRANPKPSRANKD